MNTKLFSAFLISASLICAALQAQTNRYGIASANASGNVIYTKDVTGQRTATVATVPSVVNDATNDLLVYPDPVVSTTNIVLPIPSSGTVSVYVIGLNGTINNTWQFAPGTAELTIDMSALEAGIYSVRVFDPNVGYYNMKVVKQ